MNNQQEKRFPVKPTSIMATKRYEYLLDCTEALLITILPENLGVPEVAKKANLPPQAVYRLFPSSAALIHGLASRYMELMNSDQADDQVFANWQQALRFGLLQGAAFYRNHPQAMELILGASVSRECRAADRANTRSIANQSSVSLSELAGLAQPTELVRHIEITLDITDAIWSHSYFHHQDITDYFLEESIRAATAYLSLYLPAHPLPSQ